MTDKYVQGLAVIIQCRLSSSRLPGKALKKLGGKTVFEWTMDSMKKIPAGQYIVVTDENSFFQLQPLALQHGWNIIAGPLQDVLERFCIAIREFKCKTVLRATADNPFLFYEAAQALAEEFFKQNLKKKCDYMTWTGLPHGSGVEIFDAESLLKASKETNDPYDHEHVGPALYNHKNRYTSLFYKAPVRFYFPEFRTTIDTASDYRRAISIVSKLSGGIAPAEPYTTEQIISAVTDPEVHDTVIYYPCTKKGCGTGHLRRCLEAARESGSFVYIPGNPELAETDEIVKEYLENGLKQNQIVYTFPEFNEFALIAADCFAMDKATALKLSNVANLVGIDEGGDASGCFDYLLDVIPSFGLTRESNCVEPGFIHKPVNRKASTSLQIEKILISLGGEDPAMLTKEAAEFFGKSGKDVTAILSGKSKKLDVQGVNFIKPVKNLREKIYEYDLVVTHYGLTAFEALSAGCGVILLPSTKLHENLARKYGFAILSREQLKSEIDETFFEDAERFIPEEIKEKVTQEDKSLVEMIKKLSHGKRYFCPVCGKNEAIDPVQSRTSERTFRRCSKCGLIYISWNNSLPMKYEKSYFAEQYKAQYGKTYLEDFDSIKKNSLRRMIEINGTIKLSKTTSPKILDIGCAYGPFLAAAQENGWQPYGTDIAADAVEYVRKTLLYPAVQSAFPDFDPGEEFGINKFDAVTMWFVIEHFSDLKTVLEKVSSIVKKGGVFAFSTPSGEGVSARKCSDGFYQQSPSDHFSIWEPSKAEKILKQFGFKVVKVVSTGHHPERFPNVKKHGWTKGSPMFSLYNSVSKVMRLGDTCEIYCRKITK